MDHASSKERIFFEGSKTYFTSSLFFPRTVRNDVFTLYAFLRVIDDLVDSVPQKSDEFYEMRRLWNHATAGVPSGNPLIDDFVSLSDRRAFKKEWTEAFFHSMELDLRKREYNSLSETLEYVYGSAEVIGLYLIRIMELPDTATHPARMLGRSMQYINFIRDIAEDNALGRRYLPLRDSPLTSLLPQEAARKPDAFRIFINEELDRQQSWQHDAERGFPLLPRRYRIPVATASDMYRWTAETIRRDPFVVYRYKVKPSRVRILFTIFRHFLIAGDTP